MITQSDAHKVFAFLKRKISKSARDRFVVVGGVRRQKPLVKDLDFLTNIPLDEVANRLKLPTVKQTRKRLVIFVKVPHHKVKVHVDIDYSENKCWGYALLHHTGNYMFNIIIRHHAKDLGYKLNQYGLFYIKSGKAVKGSERLKSERSILRFIGIEWHTPAEREK